MADKRDDPLAGALDRLYGTPLDAFLSSRKQLAAELKASGHADAARTLAAAPKPTRTAGALDQVARRSPELVRAMLEARDASASGQKRGDAGALREGVRDYRARVSDVLHAARDVLAEAGFDASAGQLRRMGETLQAAAVEGSETRAHLLAGTLAHDVALEDPFAGLEAGPAPAAPRERPRAPHAKPRAEPAHARAAEKAQAEAARARAEARARIEAARERLRALEGEAREARATARAAEAAAARAQAEAERARRAVDDVEARLRRAREELAAART